MSPLQTIFSSKARNLPRAVLPGSYSIGLHLKGSGGWFDVIEHQSPSERVWLLIWCHTASVSFWKGLVVDTTTQYRTVRHGTLLMLCCAEELPRLTALQIEHWAGLCSRWQRVERISRVPVTCLPVAGAARPAVSMASRLGRGIWCRVQTFTGDISIKMQMRPPIDVHPTHATHKAKHQRAAYRESH